MESPYRSRVVPVPLPSPSPESDSWVKEIRDINANSNALDQLPVPAPSLGVQPSIAAHKSPQQLPQQPQIKIKERPTVGSVRRSSRGNNITSHPTRKRSTSDSSSMRPFSENGQWNHADDDDAAMADRSMHKRAKSNSEDLSGMTALFGLAEVVAASPKVRIPQPQHDPPAMSMDMPSPALRPQSHRRASRPRASSLGIGIDMAKAVAIAITASPRMPPTQRVIEASMSNALTSMPVPALSDMQSKQQRRPRSLSNSTAASIDINSILHPRGHPSVSSSSSSSSSSSARGSFARPAFPASSLHAVSIQHKASLLGILEGGL